jgi:hypothetical protein
MTVFVRHRVLLRRVMSAVAVAFGLLTLVAGGRVLFLGVDPGYEIFWPLLVFNTTMGIVYGIAGVAFWRDLHWSVRAAGTIVALNIAVLGMIGVLYTSVGGVAVDSLRAMAFRSAVWLALLVGAWLTRPVTGDIA